MDLSIIIPTLNESKYIESTLKQIKEMKSGKLAIEIIVIDAGSKDDTCNLVKDKVDQVYRDQGLAGSKYKSLNKGGAIAQGQNLLFLDADTLVPADFDLCIQTSLNKPKVVGGAFEFSMDGKGVLYRAIECVNRMRYRVDRRYFGDQGIYCKKCVFDQLGGYPLEPIMEAAYFCKSLRSTGKLDLIQIPILTSARRFESGKVLKVFLKDTWIWIQFTLGFNIQRYALVYWKENNNGDNF